jgi:hypothetical protein
MCVSIGYASSTGSYFLKDCQIADLTKGTKNALRPGAIAGGVILSALGVALVFYFFVRAGSVARVGGYEQV